jgi:putative oxidoreductase
MPFYQRMLASTAPKATFLIRLLVGLAMAPSVGAVEIVCGSRPVLGLLSRLATVPLLSAISVAIASAKLPKLFAGNLWGMADEARADY